MKQNDPVGVFDSGLGGLSVVDTIRRLLPHENLIFFGDSARNPYGTKTKEQVRAFSMEIVEDLKKRGVKAVVIACNTATSAAAKALREHYDFDIVGMEPALKLAAKMKTPSRIAVWATPLTLREDKFHTLKERFDKDHDIVPVACEKLVRLVEDGKLDDLDTIDRVLEEYLELSGDPEIIVLGCTHFIFFKKRLEQLCKKGVRVVDGNEGTVRQLERLLRKKNLLNTQKEAGSLELCNSIEEKIGQSEKLLEKLEEQQ